jgi:aspartyl protease family protein
MSEDPAQREQKSIGTGMYVLGWLVLGTLMLFFFKDLLERQQNPNRELITRYGDDGVREVELQRNRYGHYVTSGEINGQAVVFIIDTGATGVAIPELVARRLKLSRGVAFDTQTANGMATSYAARLDSVRVGEIELHDVSAGITPGLQGNEILLGMSFLRHIEFTQRGNTLVLRQYL